MLSVAIDSLPSGVQNDWISCRRVGGESSNPPLVLTRTMTKATLPKNHPTHSLWTGAATVPSLGWLLLVALLLVLACGKGEVAPVESDLQPVPDVELPSLDGEYRSLADFPDQVVVVDFWATWCGPCVLQAEIMEKLHLELEGSNVQFLAVDLGEPESVVREYARERPFSYPVLLDTEEILGDKLQIYALPTVMVVDQKGQITYLRPGIANGETLYRLIVEAGAKPS
jgi:cytochrome c biogenesis protein CcmG/thiol:disulfide interchange protein DsbE